MFFFLALSFSIFCIDSLWTGQLLRQGVVVQCLTAHIDTLTSSHVAEASPECARYVQTTLLQALEKTAASHGRDDLQQHKAQVHSQALFQQKCGSQPQAVSCKVTC